MYNILEKVGRKYREMVIVDLERRVEPTLTEKNNGWLGLLHGSLFGGSILFVLTYCITLMVNESSSGVWVRFCLFGSIFCALFYTVAEAMRQIISLFILDCHQDKRRAPKYTILKDLCLIIVAHIILLCFMIALQIDESQGSLANFWIVMSLLCSISLFCSLMYWHYIRQDYKRAS